MNELVIPDAIRKIEFSFEQRPIVTAGFDALPSPKDELRLICRSSRLVFSPSCCGQGFPTYPAHALSRLPKLWTCPNCQHETPWPLSSVFPDSDDAMPVARLEHWLPPQVDPLARILVAAFLYDLAVSYREEWLKLPQHDKFSFSRRQAYGTRLAQTWNKRTGVVR